MIQSAHSSERHFVYSAFIISKSHSWNKVKAARRLANVDYWCDDRWKHIHACPLENVVANVLPSAQVQPYSSSQARQQVLVWLDTLNRLGHGLVSQEVLEELQAQPWTVEGNLVPCTSDRHQRQTLVHLAPSTNLQIRKIHTITHMISVCSWKSKGTVSFDVVVSQTNLFIIVPRIPFCDCW
jgi:hypothetical protein